MTSLLIALLSTVSLATAYYVGYQRGYYDSERVAVERLEGE